MSNSGAGDSIAEKTSGSTGIWPNESAIVKVALPVPVRKLFDYRLPADFTLPRPGCRVNVQFGSRTMTGLVVKVCDSSSINIDKLKVVSEIIDSEPLLDSRHLDFLGWVADYYLHPAGEVLFAALPKYLRKGRALKSLEIPYWRITTPGQERFRQSPGRAFVQHHILQLLFESQDALGPESLKAVSSNWKAAIEALEKKHLVERVKVPHPAKVPESWILTATEDQQQALRSITASLNAFRCFLLFGVTGSGKTEVYLRCIAEVVAAKKQALVLVPEISLTPQLVSRFRQRFNFTIDVLHSGMSDTERMLAWNRARQGESSILIGTRSAVLVPMARPGIIILDEEHDASFKQQDGFRYQARDVAIKRASLESIPVVMGSATPSLESWHNAVQGRFELLTLEQRATAGGLPDIHLIDMEKQALENGIGNTLREGVRQCHKQGRQSLLFINRRGFAPAVCCKACNSLVLCSRCDARMTWHQQAARLVCHHCGKKSRWPERCIDCGNDDMATIGQGTENIHQTVQQMLPGATIERIDRDTTRRKGELEDRLQRAHSGEAEVLIGTQMLSKGHDFPNLDLVGILDSDQLLFSSDFRANERLFQLITQVAGRAGRADKRGVALMQTRFPDSPWMRAIAKHDYRAFAEMALEERKITEYPPFSHIALLRAEAVAQQEALKFLEAMSRQAKSLVEDNPHMRQVTLSEPVPSAMEKRAGRYRAQLLVQAPIRKPLHAFLHAWRSSIETARESRKVRWSLDIDPVDLY